MMIQRRPFTLKPNSTLSLVDRLAPLIIACPHYSLITSLSASNPRAFGRLRRTDAVSIGATSCKTNGNSGYMVLNLSQLAEIAHDVVIEILTIHRPNESVVCHSRSHV